MSRPTSLRLGYGFASTAAAAVGILQFAKTAIYPCRLMQPEYFSDPQISGPERVRVLFSSGSKRADAGQVNDEGRVLLCTGRRMSIFDSLVLDSQSQLFPRKHSGQQKRI